PHGRRRARRLIRSRPTASVAQRQHLKQRADGGSGEPPHARQANDAWQGKIRAAPPPSARRLSPEAARVESGTPSPNSRKSLVNPPHSSAQHSSPTPKQH